MARRTSSASAYWDMPQADERMALMGYRYFLADDWHWPVFANHAVNVPYAKSAAFLDCIPIWALFNKAIATVVPPWRDASASAYLGLWHALAYALQPCLAIACVRALGHRSWRAGAIAAVVFLALPTWIFRYAHPALSAHWILLWAFYLYLRGGLGWRWLVQLAVASLVTPYLAVFSLAVFVPAVLRARRSESSDARPGPEPPDERREPPAARRERPPRDPDLLDRRARGASFAGSRPGSPWWPRRAGSPATRPRRPPVASGGSTGTARTRCRGSCRCAAGSSATRSGSRTSTRRRTSTTATPTSASASSCSPRGSRRACASSRPRGTVHCSSSWWVRRCSRCRTGCS